MNYKPVTLIPLVGIMFAIRPKPTSIISTTIAKIKIHKRWLVYIIKHKRKLNPISNIFFPAKLLYNLLELTENYFE